MPDDVMPKLRFWQIMIDSESKQYNIMMLIEILSFGQGTVTDRTIFAHWFVYSVIVTSVKQRFK